MTATLTKEGYYRDLQCESCDAETVEFDHVDGVDAFLKCATCQHVMVRACGPVRFESDT